MRWSVVTFLVFFAFVGCKNKCCEFVCIDDENLTSRCQTEKVADKAECKDVIEDICGEPAADSRIQCHETPDGVECDYPATGVPWLGVDTITTELTRAARRSTSISVRRELWGVTSSLASRPPLEWPTRWIGASSSPATL